MVYYSQSDCLPAGRQEAEVHRPMLSGVNNRIGLAR